MQFLTLAQILICISNWQAIRGNEQALTSHLNSAKNFTYTVQAKEGENIHVYPGICPESNKMYMFLIDAANDYDQDEDVLFAAITQCEVVDDTFTVGQSIDLDLTIPEDEARARIASWDTGCTTWIEESLENGGRVFQAFYMPASYMEVGKSYRTHFALKYESDTTSPSAFKADLITTPVPPVSTQTPFYDFVRPVPPFDPVHFHLLSIAP